MESSQTRPKFRRTLVAGIALVLILGIIALIIFNNSKAPDTFDAGASTPISDSSTAMQELPMLRQTYDQNCSDCHGANLDGGQGPSLVDSEWKYGDGDNDLYKVISEGVPNNGMPAFGTLLTPSEIRGLVVFIREAGAGYKAGEHAEAKEFPKEPIKTQKATFSIRTVATDLDTPWSIIWLDQHTLLASIREGRLLKIDTQTGDTQIVTGGPKITEEFIHGGMLGLEKDPDFERNGWVYLAYTDEAPSSDNPAAISECGDQQGCFSKISQIQILRAKIKGDQLVDQRIIWSRPKSTYRATPNVGGRMVFGPDGMLYFSVGDRLYRPDEAQRLSLPNGKIHRITRDGKVPRDNPLYGQKGADWSIWSYGHRNPQGLAFDLTTGTFWSSEHGPRGGDELNIIRKGGNYGWPFVTLGMGYDGRAFDPHFPIGHDSPGAKSVPLPEEALFDREAAIGPVRHWTPSIAVSDIEFVPAGAFKDWQGDMIVGSLRQQRLLRLHINDHIVESEELLLDGYGDIRDISIGPEGSIYIVFNRPGRIVELREIR